MIWGKDGDVLVFNTLELFRSSKLRERGWWTSDRDPMQCMSTNKWPSCQGKCLNVPCQPNGSEMVKRVERILTLRSPNSLTA